jgi:hypothetical protein
MWVIAIQGGTQHLQRSHNVGRGDRVSGVRERRLQRSYALRNFLLSPSKEIINYVRIQSSLSVPEYLTQPPRLPRGPFCQGIKPLLLVGCRVNGYNELVANDGA